MSLNLQDWIGVAKQINDTTQVRQGERAIEQDRERNAIYQKSYDQNVKANERQWGREDKEDAIKSQESAATNFFIEHPEMIEPGAAVGGGAQPAGPSLAAAMGGSEIPPGPPLVKGGGAAGQAQPTAYSPQPTAEPSLAQAVQPQPQAPANPLAGMDPEAVRRARINAMEYIGKKALTDGAVRENIKAQAADMTGKYRGALSQSWQMLQEGDEAGAWDTIINGFNQFQPNGSTARREGGQLIMTDPTGKERAVAMPKLASFLRTEFARVNEDTTMRESVGSRLFGIKHNGDNGRDGNFEMYDPRTGQQVAFGVKLINPDTGKLEVKVYSHPFMQDGSTEIPAEQAKGLVSKEQLEAMHPTMTKEDKKAAVDRQKEAMKYMETWAKKNNSVATETPLGDAIKINPQFASDFTLAAEVISKINEQTGGTMDPARLFSQAAKMVEEAKAAAENEYLEKGAVSSSRPGQRDQEKADFVSRRASEAVNQSLGQFSPEAWKAVAGGGSGAVQRNYEQYMGGGGAAGTTYDDPGAIDMSQYPPGRKYEIDDGTGRKVVAMNVGGRFVGIDGKPIF